MKKLSIITCTYNSAAHLEECIDSICKQNLPVEIFEHIFIDAFSIDETINIIKRYKKTHPKYNIKIIQKKPMGVYNAMNVGIQSAQGIYCMFINSDDYLESSILIRYLKFTKKHQGDIYYGNLKIIDKNKKHIVPNNNIFLRKLFFRLGFNTLVYHPTALIKRNLFDELGFYDETRKIVSDFGFWLLSLKKRKKFIYFPHTISNFRVHSGSLSSNNQELQNKELKFFRKQYMGLLGTIIHKMSRLYLLFK